MIETKETPTSTELPRRRETRMGKTAVTWEPGAEQVEVTITVMAAKPIIFSIPRVDLAPAGAVLSAAAADFSSYLEKERELQILQQAKANAAAEKSGEVM